MAYVPTIPGVPAPMSYGQGYGNWQQYAGFDTTKNPFGGAGGIGVEPDKNLPAPMSSAPPPIDTSFPTPDYSVVPPKPSTGVLGANPQNSLGLKPSGQLGTMQPSTDAINSHYGV
jgi:hypothetical protein